MDGSRPAGFAEAPLAAETWPLASASGAAKPQPGPLVDGRRFRVRLLTLQPGAALPLLSHLHRAKVWIVAEGTARVHLGGDIHLLSEGDTIRIPVGLPHRAENPGRLPVLMIAVETGGYLGADDVIAHGTPG